MSDRDTSEDIENRIEQTQDELRKDLSALEEKLSPENLKAGAQDRVEEATDLVGEQAVEATRHAGEAVRDRIDDAADRFVDDKVRDSRLPVLGLVVVIGLGLVLMRVQGGRSRGARTTDRWRPRPRAAPDMGESTVRSY